jgi:hypothetical protein
VFEWSGTVGTVKEHISDSSHVTPLSKNFTVLLKVKLTKHLANVLVKFGWSVSSLIWLGWFCRKNIPGSLKKQRQCQELWLWYIQGTWIAGGTHQTSIGYHWHLSICSTMAPKHVSWNRRNWCQVSVARRWNLASRWHLLQITCQAGTSCGVRKDGNSWLPHWQPDLWLVRVLQPEVYAPLFLQS